MTPDGGQSPHPRATRQPTEAPPRHPSPLDHPHHAASPPGDPHRLAADPPPIRARARPARHPHLADGHALLATPPAATPVPQSPAIGTPQRSAPPPAHTNACPRRLPRASADAPREAAVNRAACDPHRPIRIRALTPRRRDERARLAASTHPHKGSHASPSAGQPTIRPATLTRAIVIVPTRAPSLHAHQDSHTAPPAPGRAGLPARSAPRGTQGRFSQPPARPLHGTIVSAPHPRRPARQTRSPERSIGQPPARLHTIPARPTGNQSGFRRAALPAN